MRTSLVCLVLIAVALVFLLVLPAGAAHGLGGPPGTSPGNSGIPGNSDMRRGENIHGETGVAAGLSKGVIAGQKTSEQAAGGFTGVAAMRTGSDSAAGNRDNRGPQAGHHQGPHTPRVPPGWGDGAGRYPCGPAQTTGPLPVSKVPGGESKEGFTSPRPRKEDGEEAGSQGAIGDTSPIPAIPGLFLPSLGYRRITKTNILSCDSRNRVYQAIAEHPGIDAPTLAAIVPMNINTLRYHLFALTREEKITFFSRPGTVRYFVNRGTYPPFVQCLFSYLWTDTPRAIIRLLAQTPGMTRTELALALGLAGPSVTRHMQNLAADGIVEARHAGRETQYSLTNLALSVLRSETWLPETPIVPPLPGEGAPMKRQTSYA
ncbi:MAG: winged helix-turn-helix transcriptional regulator [Methanolinea sp.]|nr:winged helix-turn-helix transcriptional regulator [Methanolinea sp.]